MATITEMAKDRPTLLIVEDNEDDIFFVERIFKQIGARCELKFARDGIEAIELMIVFSTAFGEKNFSMWA